MVNWIEKGEYVSKMTYEVAIIFYTHHAKYCATLSNMLFFEQHVVFVSIECRLRLNAKWVFVVLAFFHYVKVIAMTAEKTFFPDVFVVSLLHLWYE